MFPEHPPNSPARPRDVLGNLPSNVFYVPNVSIALKLLASSSSSSLFSLTCISRAAFLATSFLHRPTLLSAFLTAIRTITFSFILLSDMGYRLCPFFSFQNQVKFCSLDDKPILCFALFGSSEFAVVIKMRVQYCILTRIYLVHSIL